MLRLYLFDYYTAPSIKKYKANMYLKIQTSLSLTSK